MRRSDLHVVGPGVASIGVAFGMARYGYGLLLPDMRHTLRLGDGTLGAIAAASYVTYLIATASTAVAAARVGARVLVVGSGLLGAAGMLLLATAHGALGLAAGAMVAGTAAGLAFAPLSDVVTAELPPERRAHAWGWISSGTGAGVAVAAPVAILAGTSWRAAWVGFAVLALAVAAVAAVVLPGGQPRDRRDPVPRLHWRWFVCARSGPLLGGAFLVGLAASVWWTFAVDLVATDGGLGTTQSRVLDGVVGVASLLGALAAGAIRRFGVRTAYATFVVLFTASLLALALAPGDVALALVAGTAFGATYNLLVTLSGLWSAEVFADRPSSGLAAMSAMNGLGLLVGPLLAGPLAGALSLRAVFALAAAVAALTLALRPRGVLGGPAPA